jgi:hypothetical protein
MPRCLDSFMSTRLADDEVAIYAAVGLAQTKLARLEYEICLVFRETVSPLSHVPNQALSAISPADDAFWLIVSFEAKLKMTNAAIERHLGSRSRYVNSTLLMEWTKTSKRVGEKAGRRNKLAHGMLEKEAMRDGSAAAVFVPFYFKIMTGYQVQVHGPDFNVRMGLPGAPAEKWDARGLNL